MLEHRKVLRAEVTDSYGNPHIVRPGVNKVTLIKYHETRGEGDKSYLDIEYENGETERTFRIEQILFEKKKEDTPYYFNVR